MAKFWVDFGKYFCYWANFHCYDWPNIAKIIRPWGHTVMASLNRPGKYHCTIDLLFILFTFSCFTNAELVTYLLVWLNSNQSNRREPSIDGGFFLFFHIFWFLATPIPGKGKSSRLETTKLLLFYIDYLNWKNRLTPCCNSVQLNFRDRASVT